MRAMILAAGLGTRLRPLTDSIPKVMVPIDGKPLLQYHLELLRKYGITEIAVNLFYLPDIVTAYFGDGSKFGVSLNYSHEETLTGTAGAVKKLETFFDESFLVIYGDNLIEVDLSRLVSFHNASRGIVTIGVYRHSEPWTQGILEVDQAGKVLNFCEKPDRRSITSDLANAGVYVVEPCVVDKIPENTPYDFGKDLFPELLNKGESIYAFEIGGYIQDIGTPERYAKACHDVKIGRVWK